MPLITDTRSGFEDYFKKYRAEDEATSRWEQFLTGLREGYDVSAQAVGAQTAYDISGAYSNYLRQQRALQQSNILSETYKSQMAQGLLGQYESSFAQAQTERAQALGELQQNVLEQYQQGQEAATNWANKASQLTEALYQYGGYVDEGKDYNLQLAGYDVSEGGLGFYTQAPGSTELSLTAAGEEFYDKLLNREITRPVKGEDGGFQIRYGFADWLRNESGLEDANELADWYEQNQAQYKEALGGKRVSDAETTEDEALYRPKAVEARERYNLTQKSFDTYQEEYEYYRNSPEAMNYDVQQLKNVINNNRGKGTVRPEDVKNELIKTGISEENIKVKYIKKGNVYSVEINESALSERDKNVLKEAGFELNQDSDNKNAYITYVWMGGSSGLSSMK